jgi:hypothetical protein
MVQTTARSHHEAADRVGRIVHGLIQSAERTSTSVIKEQQTRLQRTMSKTSRKITSRRGASTDKPSNAACEKEGELSGTQQQSQHTIGSRGWLNRAAWTANIVQNQQHEQHRVLAYKRGMERIAGMLPF